MASGKITKSRKWQNLETTKNDIGDRPKSTADDSLVTKIGFWAKSQGEIRILDKKPDQQTDEKLIEKRLDRRKQHFSQKRPLKIF